ncbi:MAG TPA: hypothetical protein VK964_00730 [Nocardioidaceae bacterium]|nr:hypothetical protein [Nocardioidaceae bacterium]
MSTSAPQRHKVPARRADPTRVVVAEGTRFSRYVTWAWGLIAVTLPVGILSVLLVEALGQPGWADAGLYVAVAAPLVASVVVGLLGWWRESEPLALRGALFSVFLLVVGTVLVGLTL